MGFDDPYIFYVGDGEKTRSFPMGIKFEKTKQVGGDHYSKLPIQPLEYALANGLGIMEHAVVKYTTRHKDKGGKQDLEKAIDYLQKMIQHYYPES